MVDERVDGAPKKIYLETGFVIDRCWPRGWLDVRQLKQQVHIVGMHVEVWLRHLSWWRRCVDDDCVEPWAYIIALQIGGLHCLPLSGRDCRLGDCGGAVFATPRVGGVAAIA